MVDDQIHWRMRLVLELGLVPALVLGLGPVLLVLERGPVPERERRRQGWGLDWDQGCGKRAERRISVGVLGGSRRRRLVERDSGSSARTW